MRRAIAIAIVGLVLAGCKAELVEIRINSSDITRAIEDGAATARFVANFSTFGELDAEQRQQIDAMESILESNLTIDDFQITTAEYKTNIAVEGVLPIVIGDPGSAKGAFAVYVSAFADPLLPGFSHFVQLSTGKAFQRMESDMQGVSYMLAIDAVQPVQYRLRADSGGDLKILAGGVQIDGENYPLRSMNLPEGERISLTFSGGAYENVSGGFLFSQP